MKYLILSMTLLLHGAAEKLCTEEEYQKNNDKVSECIKNYHDYINEVLQSDPSSDTKRLVCDYISMAVDNCFKMLDQCEDSDSVLSLMRNNLIQGLINAGGSYSQECQVVVQHRSSRSQQTTNGEIHEKDSSYSDMTYYSDYDGIERKERSTPDTDDCSEAAMQRADNYMENCTSFIGTKTYNRLQATTDPNEASQILCSALADIDTDCVKFATSCLTPQYVSWFIDPIKKYLHDITATKVGEENIPNCNSRDSQQGHSNQAYHATKEAFDDHEPYDTQESYDTQKAFNMGESHYSYESTPKYNYIGNHRVMSQVRSDNEHNYEDRVVEDVANNVLKACSETILNQQMNNCSHITYMNFNKDIQDIYDSARLHKTACQALQVIATECVRDMEGCYSTVDIGEIRDVQVEEWKTFFVKLVNEGNGIRLSLDNCYSQKTEDEAQYLREQFHEDERGNEYKEDARRDEHNEDSRRNEYREDIRREEYEEGEERYKHKEDMQMAEYRRRDEYNTNEDPWDEHNGRENTRREEYSEQGSTPYQVQSENDHDIQANKEYCSESNTKMAEDHMDTCTQKVATKAYSQISNSADSVFISNVLCSTRAMIDSQCVQDLKACFSSQYISWLVEPIQSYLHKLAITKVDERSLQSCQDFNYEHYETSDENRQKVEENIKEEKYKEDLRIQEYKENLRYTDYEEEYNAPHNRNAEDHENTGNYEHKYPERRNNNEQNRCSEASLYERMGNCSHFAALKVHTEIHHVIESHMLNNIACDALNVIGTDCAKDLYDCYSKIDADEIRILQIEEWTVFIVEMIEGRSGIKLTLDNCYQLTTERTDVDYHKVDYASNQNQGNQNIGEETETHQYTKEPEDIWEEEYKRHEDQEYNRYDGYNQEIYHCTESEKKSAQDQADRCIKSVANDAYSTSNSVTDPRIISRNLCLAKSKIDTECVNHLTNCFPSEYISWLTDPMKKHLQELAIGKVGAEYLETCYGHEIEPTQETTHRYIPPEIEHTESPQYPYHVQDIGQYVDPSCSETILYERMDNCSRRIALNVWANTKDNPSSSRVSDIICEALTQIGTTCLNVLSNCFAATEVSEMRTGQIRQWIKYFVRITPRTRLSSLSIESCRWMTNPYVDTNERNTAISSYDHNQEYIQPTTRTVHHTYETTPRTTYRHYETTPRTSYYHYETTQLTPRYTGYKAVDHQEEYEDCSEIRLEQTLTEMSNCSYSTAINVHWELHTIADHDPNSITNILCNALTIIATDCVNVLHKCYNTDNIREMKTNELIEMQKYLLRLVKIDYDYRSLQSCEVIAGSYDFATEERTEQRYQEYYAQESRDYRIQEDSGYAYQDPHDYGYQDNTGYGNQYNSDHRYQDNTGYTSEDHSSHGYQDDSAYRYQDNAVQGHTGYTNQESTDYQAVDAPYEHFNEARSGKFCSQAKLQLADDHMANCTRLAAHNASSLLRDIRESNDAFNILCSALTSIDSDCANLLRECHSDEYVTWMLEPMKGYLIDLGEGKVDSESLQDCKYSNRFSPYRLQ